MSTKKKHQRRANSKKNNRPTEKRNNNRTKKRKNKSKVKFNPGKTRKKKVKKMKKRSNKNNMKLIGGAESAATPITTPITVDQDFRRIPMLSNKELIAQFERRRKRYIYRMLCKLCSRVTRQSTHHIRLIRTTKAGEKIQLNICYYKAYVTIFNHQIFRPNDLAMDTSHGRLYAGISDRHHRLFLKFMNISVINNMPILKGYATDEKPIFNREELTEILDEDILKSITTIDEQSIDLNKVKKYYLLGIILLINCTRAFIFRNNIESSYVNDFNFFTKWLKDNIDYSSLTKCFMTYDELDTLLTDLDPDHGTPDFQKYLTGNYILQIVRKINSNRDDILIPLSQILADYLFLKGINMILCIRNLTNHFPIIQPSSPVVLPPNYSSIYYTEQDPLQVLDLDNLPNFNDEDMLEIHYRPEPLDGYLHLGPQDEIDELARITEPPPEYTPPQDMTLSISPREQSAAAAREYLAAILLEETLIQQASFNYQSNSGGGHKNIHYGGSAPPTATPSKAIIPNPTDHPTVPPTTASTDQPPTASQTEIVPLKNEDIVFFIKKKELDLIISNLKAILKRLITDEQTGKKKLRELYPEFIKQNQAEIKPLTEKLKSKMNILENKKLCEDFINEHIKKISGT